MGHTDVPVMMDSEALYYIRWRSFYISTAVVDSYNTELYVHSWLECTDVLVMMDNEALYDIRRRSLDIEHTTSTA